MHQGNFNSHNALHSTYNILQNLDIAMMIFIFSLHQSDNNHIFNLVNRNKGRIIAAIFLSNFLQNVTKIIYLLYNNIISKLTALLLMHDLKQFGLRKRTLIF
jgi:hypothetical protein